MSIAFVTIILIVLAAIAALAVIMGVVLTVAGRTDEPSRGARRRIQILYGTAALVGISFTLLVVYAFPTVYVNSTEVPGLLAALGPSLAGILFVDVAALGESFWPKPKGEQRGAYLTRRPALANAASVPKWATVIWGALLTAFLIFAGFVATSDGESAGRSIPHMVTDPNVSGASGPFPGWPYGIPMLIGAAFLALFTLGVLHVIARRPAVGGTTPEEDAALRRISATNLVKGVQLSLAASLAAVLFVGGTAAHNAHWWWGAPLAVAAAVVATASIVVLAWRTK